MKRYDLAIDFDGVLHSYVSGWEGPGTIGDLPNPGAIAWVNSLTPRGITYCIFSMRNQYEEGPPAIRKWLNAYGAMVRLTDEDFPIEKPNANLMLDDHGMLFTGVFPTPEKIKSFHSWAKG